MHSLKRRFLLLRPSHKFLFLLLTLILLFLLLESPTKQDAQESLNIPTGELRIVAVGRDDMNGQSRAKREFSDSTGCNFPKLETFGAELIKFIKKTPPLQCSKGPIFYRWQQVLPSHSWMKTRGPKSRFLSEYGYLFVATPLAPILYGSAADDINIIKEEFRAVSFQKKRRILLQKYPNDSNLADIEGFYWFNIEKHPTFIYGLSCGLFWMSYVIVMMAFCNVSMIRTLNDLRVHMSAATRRMHFRFLRMIALQTAVPMIWVVIPMAYMITVIFKDIRFHRIQDANNIALSTASSHGFAVSVYLLATNPAYREVLYSLFILPIRKLFGYVESGPISAANSSVAPSSMAVVT